MYTRLKSWKELYAMGSTDDRRAVENFIECETREVVAALRTELMQIVNGNFKPETLQVLLGPVRATRHGSYEEWAKVLLQWMAIYNRH